LDGDQREERFGTGAPHDWGDVDPSVVTVGGDWANRPSVAIEDAAAVPQLGLELVEEQFARHIEWQEQQHRLEAAARDGAFHVTPDPDPQVRPAGRGWWPSVSRPGAGEVD
jgi:hypothetical protein